MFIPIRMFFINQEGFKLRCDICYILEESSYLQPIQVAMQGPETQALQPTS